MQPECTIKWSSGANLSVVDVHLLSIAVLVLVVRLIISEQITQGHKKQFVVRPYSQIVRVIVTIRQWLRGVGVGGICPLPCNAREL